ncbi:Thioredoxin-like fold containing protein [Trema orientale]|uniref:Thioredoxin-like fold containing protein n=1 Tax=Trema orientale TaxID=63057 RepID=A0A2P5FM24_TREOI|nr:Thioredoxin-like fold containing protein [Trema orientale]
MADSGKILEIAENSGSSVPTSTQKPSLNRASSFKKLYSSVKKLKTIFEAARATIKPKPTKTAIPDCRLPGTEDRIVVYLTSLRGIRRTFEDCYAVQMIFRGFRLWIDERDISMDSAYRKELESVLGEKNASLPQVFIGGKYIGGAEVIKQMFETGELAKILKGFRVREAGFACESCGDVRFVPCWNCSGSRKVFDEDQGLLKRCLECNENGLIRCPDCCS